MRTPLVLALVALCCPLLSVAPGARADGSLIPTLLESLETSDFVAIGDVVSTEQGEVADENGMYCGGVRDAFRAETVLKGQVEPGTTVDIVSLMYSVAFRPKREGDRRFLVFAKTSAFPGRYVRTLEIALDVSDPGDRAAFEGRTREALEILTAGGPELDRRLVEWDVRCVEARETRGEGIGDLWMRQARRPYDAAARAYVESPITKPDRDRIAAVLAREEVDGAWSDVKDLVEFFAIVLDDERGLDALRRRLECEADAPSADAQSEMYTLASYSGWEAGKTLVEEYPSDGPLDARRAFVRRFLELYAARDDG